MSTIDITVDGKACSVASDARPTNIFADNKDIVVTRINGVLKDLWSDLTQGDVVEGVSISSPDGLAVLRHSTAHVMAQAVQELYANTRLGIGPPIKDGFYYDFDPTDTFNPDDLVKIESAMRKIVKEGQRFRRRIITESETWEVSEQWSKQTPLVDSIIASADAHEGSLAFTEKRAPEWQGK